MGVTHTEGHAANRRPVLGGKIRRDAFRFVVQDQVDVALAVQVHILGTVGRHLGEAHDLEDRFQNARGGRCELDEFKAHQAHRVFKNVGHAQYLIIKALKTVITCYRCRAKMAARRRCPSHCVRGSHHRSA
ncbi:hypothetical protein D3C78_1559910 [compost metagenome]